MAEMDQQDAKVPKDQLDLMAKLGQREDQVLKEHKDQQEHKVQQDNREIEEILEILEGKARADASVQRAVKARRGRLVVQVTWLLPCLFSIGFAFLLI